jgi:hypothetical protein
LKEWERRRWMDEGGERWIDEWMERTCHLVRDVDGAETCTRTTEDHWEGQKKKKRRGWT